jgi:hypothetical protein
MRTKRKIKHKSACLRRQRCRLLPPQPLCRHRFKNEGDVSDHMCSISIYLPLPPCNSWNFVKIIVVPCTRNFPLNVWQSFSASDLFCKNNCAQYYVRINLSGLRFLSAVDSCYTGTFKYCSKIKSRFLTLFTKFVQPFFFLCYLQLDYCYHTLTDGMTCSSWHTCYAVKMSRIGLWAQCQDCCIWLREQSPS